MLEAGLGLGVDPAERAQELSLVVRRVDGEELVDEGGDLRACGAGHDALGERGERLHLVRVQEHGLRAGHACARVGGGDTVDVGQVIADRVVLGDGGQGQAGPGRAHQAQDLAPAQHLWRLAGDRQLHSLGHARPRRWPPTVAPRPGPDKIASRV
jgi:hypothetical protein